MLRPADGAGCGGERQTRGERFQSTRSTENSIRASGPCRRGQASPGAAGRLRASRWSGGRGRVRLRSSVAMRGSRACRASADEALQPRGARTATLAPGKVPPGNRDGASPLGAVEQWGRRQARARSTRALARPATRGDRGRLPRVGARGQGRVHPEGTRASRTCSRRLWRLVPRELTPSTLAGSAASCGSVWKGEAAEPALHLESEGAVVRPPPLRPCRLPSSGPPPPRAARGAHLLTAACRDCLPRLTRWICSGGLWSQSRRATQGQWFLADKSVPCPGSLTVLPSQAAPQSLTAKA